jgi:hypothetical protein
MKILQRVSFGKNCGLEAEKGDSLNQKTFSAMETNGCAQMKILNPNGDVTGKRE